MSQNKTTLQWLAFKIAVCFANKINVTKPKFYQVILVESNPFGETLFPFQFSVSDKVNDETMKRLSRAAWHNLTGRRKLGFYTSVNVTISEMTVEDQTGKVPDVDRKFRMGRYTNTRRVHPTTHLSIVD